MSSKQRLLCDTLMVIVVALGLTGGVSAAVLPYYVIWGTFAAVDGGPAPITDIGATGQLAQVSYADPTNTLSYQVTAPASGIYNTLSGQWEVENIGIAPDIEVEQDPALVRHGHDPQLEKAIELAMEELKKNPPLQFRRPAFPKYH